MFTLKVLFDVTPALVHIFNGGHREIMATLADIQEATRLNGEAARAAILEVANDFAAITAQIVTLQEQIVALQAAVDAGAGNAAEVARLTALIDEMNAGLESVKTDLDTTTAGLAGLNPVP